MESVIDTKAAPFVLYSDEVVEGRPNEHAAKAVAKCKTFLLSRQVYDEQFKVIFLQAQPLMSLKKLLRPRSLHVSDTYTCSGNYPGWSEVSPIGVSASRFFLLWGRPLSLREQVRTADGLFLFAVCLASLLRALRRCNLISR